MTRPVTRKPDAPRSHPSPSPLEQAAGRMRGRPVAGHEVLPMSTDPPKPQPKDPQPKPSDPHTPPPAHTPPDQNPSPTKQGTGEGHVNAPKK
jgi:hypothetical protein